jgi:ABC-type antimicrobial peptide transport system permease subunit
MGVGRLVWSEMTHRKLSTWLAVLAIAVAVASSVGAVTLIRAHEHKTARRVAELDDEIRKITKNMGFNVIVLPKDQNLADFHASDFAEKTMPFEFVKRLADSPDIVTVNHLRPALVRKMEWPERKRQILLMGVSGVVPFSHRRDDRKPLSEPVPPGTIHVGHLLAAELQLSEGDAVTLAGHSLKIGTVYPQRGSKDDITVWIDLPAAQEILSLPGRINMIQALECNCASVDRLAEIQQEISRLLGGEVQVIELATTAIARAKAREEVKAAGRSSVARLERLASVFLPLVVGAAGLMVGLLSLANVRERRAEIGILRAIGTRSRQIFGLFLTKGLLLGVWGAWIGYLCGYVAAAGLERLSLPEDRLDSMELFQPGLLLWVSLMAPLLAVVASWIPAVLAARQDPAVVLREE